MTFTCSQCGSAEIEVRPYGHFKPQGIVDIVDVVGNTPNDKPPKGERYVHTCQKCGHQDLVCTL